MRAILYNLLLLIMTIIWLSSCTSTVKLTRPIPPIIDLEEKANIVLINSYDPNEQVIRNEKERWVYRSGMYNLIEGLTENKTPDDRIRIFVCDTVVADSAASMYKTLQDPEYFNFICDQTGATHILEIDTFTLDMYSSEDEKVENELSFRDFIIAVHTKLVLYDQDGKIVNISEPEESVRHKTRLILLRWIELEPALSKAGKNVDYVAKLLGQKYLRRFYSSLDYYDRMFHTGKYFERVTPLIKNEDWIAARDELLKLSKSENPKIPQKKVAHNLAVVYEALNDPVKFEEWRQKSGSPKFSFY